MTVGVYDGVHRGHRALLKRLRAEASRRGARAVAVVFEPHPRCVLDPERCPPRLTAADARETLIRRAGADAVVTLPFTRELSRWPAVQFCDALIERLGMTVLVEGSGFAMGHAREGDLAFLRRHGHKRGFGVVEVEPGYHRGQPVSATRIRAALAAGRPGDAAAMLGRPYALHGRVVAGEGMGRQLGYPTANLQPDAGRCLPGIGVYAGWFDAGEGWRPAAISVGVRPTFGAENPLTVEAYVLDFDGNLYERRARIAFVRRLREERRFSSEEDLRAAMAHDVARTRAVLGQPPP